MMPVCTPCRVSKKINTHMKYKMSLTISTVAGSCVNKTEIYLCSTSKITMTSRVTSMLNKTVSLAYLFTCSIFFFPKK